MEGGRVGEGDCKVVEGHLDAGLDRDSTANFSDSTFLGAKESGFTQSLQPGYEIPAGWKVLPIITGVHLDPSLHSDPSLFNPHRWKRVDTSEKNFMPFGGGKRKCPGNELARLEVCFFIHHLVRSYRWNPLSRFDWPISHPYLDFKDGFQIAIRSLDF